MTKKEKIYHEWKKIGVDAPGNINGWAAANVAVEAQMNSFARPISLKGIEINDLYPKS